jgi:hypothetical protein
MDRAWFELAGSCLSRMIQMEGKKTGCFVRKHDDDEKKIRQGKGKWEMGIGTGTCPTRCYCSPESCMKCGESSTPKRKMSLHDVGRGFDHHVGDMRACPPPYAARSV